MAARERFLMLWGTTILSTLVLSTAVGVAMAQTKAQPVVPPDGPKPFINILTAGTVGVYYALGGALSNIFAAKIPGARPSVQTTKGSVENLNLLQQGKGEIALTQGNTLVFAWAGDVDAGALKFGPKPFW